jgi:DNA-binding SARP family transcriptional activator
VPPPDVDVAVLGPVAVRTQEPFRRAGSLELVVYLALQDRPVRHEEWAAALWPERALSSATVHSTASDARRALGRGADGALLLPRHGGALRLSPSVVTDVARFGELARAGDPAGLLDAMRLVRGPLLSGVRRSDWAVLDGTHAAIEKTVVDAALGGAELLCERGRAAEAAWVVRRALLVSPYDERLYRALLRATAGQGSRAGLRTVMGELLVLAAGPDGVASDPADGLDPTTTDLYRDLLRGSPAAGGHLARL